MPAAARHAPRRLPAAGPLRRSDGRRDCGASLQRARELRSDMERINLLRRSRNMNQRLLASALAASAVAVAAGCATYDGAQDYSVREERVIQSVTYGTVQSVRAVRLDDNGNPVGTVAGAAVGGILGSEIGHGAGSAVGAILGAVGGGLA